MGNRILRYAIGHGRWALDRRQFLGRLSLGGAALASWTGLCALPALADDIELNYTFWPFGDEVIEENARVFIEQYGTRISLQPTSGDYASVIETKLLSGTRLDLFRAQRGQASRWFAAEWLRPIDDMPDLDEIKKEEFPSIAADSLSWPDHKRMGLTYYNGGPYCLFRNEKVLSAGGYQASANPSDYPQTWDDIYKQAVDLKKKGIVENPILPTWFKSWTGTPWALYAHCASEGDGLVDDDMKSTFGLDTPILKVLSDWKRWWDEELVPRAILTWQEPQMASSWMKGLHAFHYQSDYNSFAYSDPKNGEFAQYFNMNPVMPGATHGTTLVGHALHVMSNTPRSDAELQAAFNLMKSFSWRDKNHELRMPKAWARLANLQEPYPEVYADPDVKQAIMKWMYPPLAAENYKWLFEGRQRAVAANLLRAGWQQEWEVGMQQMIEDELLLKGVKTPREVVVAMKDSWETLRSKYVKP
ncbi:MAG TPA: ABC transporter substrate-binding protein [Roseiarcus sp.]|jgi:multiple sugar transport system substrate-binding protein